MGIMYTVLGLMYALICLGCAVLFRLTPPTISNNIKHAIYMVGSILSGTVAVIFGILLLIL